MFKSDSNLVLTTVSTLCQKVTESKQFRKYNKSGYNFRQGTKKRRERSKTQNNLQAWWYFCSKILNIFLNINLGHLFLKRKCLICVNLCNFGDIWKICLRARINFFPVCKDVRYTSIYCDQLWFWYRLCGFNRSSLIR